MKHLEIGGYIQVSLHKINSYSNSRPMKIFSGILWNVTLATSLLTPLNPLWVTQNDPAIKMLGSFICMYDGGCSHPHTEMLWPAGARSHFYWEALCSKSSWFAWEITALLSAGWMSWIFARLQRRQVGHVGKDDKRCYCSRMKWMVQRVIADPRLQQVQQDFL